MIKLFNNFGHSKPIIIMHPVSSLILLELIVKFQSLQNNSRGKNLFYNMLPTAQ